MALLVCGMRAGRDMAAGLCRDRGVGVECDRAAEPSTTTQFYRHLVWRWGIPEGRGEITREMSRRLETSYAVYNRRDDVIALSRLNGSRFPRENQEGIAYWVVHGTDRTGIIYTRVEAFDRKKHPVLELGPYDGHRLKHSRRVEYFDLPRPAMLRFEMPLTGLEPGQSYCDRPRAIPLRASSDEAFERHEALTLDSSDSSSSDGICTPSQLRVMTAALASALFGHRKGWSCDVRGSQPMVRS